MTDRIADANNLARAKILTRSPALSTPRIEGLRARGNFNFPVSIDQKRTRIVLVSLLATFIVLRLSLHLSPNSDFDVAGYNIHHLFTGLLLVTAGGIPAVLFQGHSLWTDIACAAFGAGLGMTLDEWVYLIATDGSNASYLLPVSLRGGIVMISLATLYIAVLYLISRRRN